MTIVLEFKILYPWNGNDGSDASEVEYFILLCESSVVRKHLAESQSEDCQFVENNSRKITPKENMDYTSKLVRQKAFQKKLEDKHRRNVSLLQQSDRQ